MGKSGSAPTKSKRLTEAGVRKMLKARGLKATATELADLTAMMNADLERETAEKEAAAARERHSKAVDRFMADLLRPVRAEERAAKRKAARKKR